MKTPEQIKPTIEKKKELPEEKEIKEVSFEDVRTKEELGEFAQEKLDNVESMSDELLKSGSHTIESRLNSTGASELQKKEGKSRLAEVQGKIKELASKTAKNIRRYGLIATFAAGTAFGSPGLVPEGGGAVKKETKKEVVKEEGGEEKKAAEYKEVREQVKEIDISEAIKEAKDEIGSPDKKTKEAVLNKINESIARQAPDAKEYEIENVLFVSDSTNPELRAYKDSVEAYKSYYEVRKQAKKIEDFKEKNKGGIKIGSKEHKELLELEEKFDGLFLNNQKFAEKYEPAGQGDLTPEEIARLSHKELSYWGAQAKVLKFEKPKNPVFQIGTEEAKTAKIQIVLQEEMPGSMGRYGVDGKDGPVTKDAWERWTWETPEKAAVEKEEITGKILKPGEKVIPIPNVTHIDAVYNKDNVVTLIQNKAGERIEVPPGASLEETIKKMLPDWQYRGVR